MKPINPLRLLFIGLVLTVAGWSATVVTTRYSMATPVLPATALATMAVIVAITLILGIRVLRWRNSTKRKKALDPILAARTLVLAQACAYAGTVLLGWHAGIFLDQLRIWNLRSDQGITWVAVAVAGGGLVMIVVGLLVERFCRIPPEDTEASGDGTPGRKVRGEAAGEGEYAYRGD
ncbi:MAG: hypothetical protein JWR71_466 [Pseudarthrobacter sp.]|uniref:DUF3180 domain-containing protein n=1 Tax=Pseudarthrobacter sp. BIM B-2242 TaxID=2772401 RepID=UPI00168AFA85|nr:DUF3180 domain-containing protein [Pseudarthrobacter sp. BIM B-2242]MCU1433741.1 hypothetical protein [Pseudarthrobacter sp.]QOD03744.1 DUF3180 domain-containing protein [Pseudarthrobacter sp. BIM B-2242]